MDEHNTHSLLREITQDCLRGHDRLKLTKMNVPQRYQRLVEEQDKIGWEKFMEEWMTRRMKGVPANKMMSLDYGTKISWERIGATTLGCFP